MRDDEKALQQRIGGRVRARRRALGLTLRELAGSAGLSERFLSGVEGGQANISIGRLGQLAGALGLPLAALVRPDPEGPRAAIEGLLDGCDPIQLAHVLSVIQVMMGRRTPGIIGLLGIRGAGKSRVGAALAQALGLPFLELDDRIQARAALPVGEIFTVHGADHYRALERACLADLVAAGAPCVVALPGGIVDAGEAMALLRDTCTTLWLRASADDYWDRVFAQGDTRPMSGRAEPRQDLRALVARRHPLYAQADLVVDTSGVPPDQVVARALAALDAAGRRPSPAQEPPWTSTAGR